MYDELLEKEIIPAIERENSEELSVHEMEEFVEKLDEKVNEYNQKLRNAKLEVNERRFVPKENILSKR